MPLESVKATVATVWVSAVCAASLAGYVQPLSGWTALVGVAVLPPLVMMWQWHSPRHRLSEAIHEARR